MTTANGSFEITSMEEDVYQEGEGEVRLTRARGSQRFTGGIEGEGSVEWLMCYWPDGAARFVGLQRVEGSLGEFKGSFVMESSGDHDGTQSKGTWTVIPGSGTGDLTGLTGEGGFEAPGREVSYWLEFRIE